MRAEEPMLSNCGAGEDSWESCKEPTHWKRLWCWERLRAGGEEGNRGWDGWMASSTQWTWVCTNCGRWWRTGNPGMLQSMGVAKSQTWLREWTTIPLLSRISCTYLRSVVMHALQKYFLPTPYSVSSFCTSLVLEHHQILIFHCQSHTVPLPPNFHLQLQF